MTPARALHSVAPITIVCLVGLGFLAASYTLRPLPRFDPLNTISIVTAASCGNLALDRSAAFGAPPDDEPAASTSVQFAPHAGTWGLVRRF